MSEQPTTSVPRPGDAADTKGPHDPATTLGYASASRTGRGWCRWSGPLRRIIVIAGATMGLIAVFVAGFHWERGLEACPHCGATRRISSLGFFALKFDYGERMSYGVVSELLKPHLDPADDHQWKFADGRSYTFGRRWLGSGSGLQLFSRIRYIELIPGAAEMLRQKAESDPGFTDRLRKAVYFEDYEADLEFLVELGFELESRAFGGP